MMQHDHIVLRVSEHGHDPGAASLAHMWTSLEEIELAAAVHVDGLIRYYGANAS
jgi:hypothetical protein